jgi:D-3-phosphoglycerate dehydrogenase
MPHSKWNVLIPANIKNEGVALLDDIAHITSADELGGCPLDLRDHIAEFDAIIHRTFDLSSEVLSHAENLKIISKHGVGLDTVDIQTANDLNIVVCNTPGTNSRAVAEHTICFLFAVNNNIVECDRHVREGKWARHQFLRKEIRDRTLGVFGYGDIGKETAKLASGLDLNCVAYDPYVSHEDVPGHIELSDSKSDFFTSCDIVCIHVPLTDETKETVGKQELEALGKSGILINTSRGGVIDEEALVDALRNGTIKGSGLDTFTNEPPLNSRLTELDNVILSPHVGGATHEARIRSTTMAAENIIEVYEGRLPETTVNADSVSF